MTNADMAYGTITDGAPVIKDTKATGHDVPADDATNNFTNIKGTSLTGGGIVLAFDRLFDTGDATGDYIIPVNVAFDALWAFGNTLGTEHTNTNRGTMSVTITTPDVSAISDNGFTLAYTIKEDNSEITWKVTAPTTGWLSLAFGDNGSDIIYGSVNGSTVTVKDAKSGSPNPVDDATEKREWRKYYSDVRSEGDTGDSTDDVVLPLDASLNPNLSGTTELLSKAGFTLSYKLSSDSQSATWVIKSTGKWAGVGFGATSMSSADVAYGTITDGVPVVKDTKTSGHKVPADDTTNNITNVLGTNTDSGIVLQFDRKLNTGDSEDFVIPQLDTSFDIIWAFGDTFGSAHGDTNADRGTASIEIEGPEDKEIVRSEGTKALGANHSIAWKVYENDTIKLTYTAPTAGWIGIGFGSSTSMAGADFYYVKDNALVDANGTSNGAPAVDATQHGSDFSVSTTNNVTTMSFTRALNTGDNDDYAFVPGNSIPALWAYGETTTFGNHGSTNRGFTTFTLVEKAYTAGTATFPNGAPTGLGLKFRGYDPDGNDDDVIVFEFTAPTTGWLGIGFGVSETMIGGDILYYGKPTSSDPLQLVDMKATANSAPTKDSVQDGKLLKYTPGTNTSTLKFARKFNTGDADDYTIQKTGDLNVIWAYGTESAFGYHGTDKRGTVTLAINAQDGTNPSSSSTYLFLPYVLVFLLPILSTFFP
eukprot:CAMPEP_0115006026 /NCGR_PEP_ID=MMETSP0216-20121206/20236_1 /TAXON_ID=223996 /ORGANISM="Protocruzia adherens, Strain Boccale" /LENGTH=703 /DNA_ID=CAMNT_0002372493 /DNA_START=82 /DNA_END=2194 /DNA_ORIENTATION=+